MRPNRVKTLAGFSPAARITPAMRGKSVPMSPNAPESSLRSNRMRTRGSEIVLAGVVASGTSVWSHIGVNVSFDCPIDRNAWDDSGILSRDVAYLEDLAHAKSDRTALAYSHSCSRGRRATVRA